MILLTGATGFLGFRLLNRLLEWQGQVRVIVRDAKKLQAMLPDRFRARGVVDFVEGDLTKPHINFDPIFQGIDAVIHNAAMVHVGSERFAPMNQINVLATKRLLDATPRSCYFLQIGSVIAYGPTGIDPVDERTPFPATAISPYEATKRAAVILARERMNESFPVGILNPGIIYGPGAHGALTRFAHLVAQRKLPVFSGSQSLGSFVHVDDVVEAAIEMVKRREQDEYIAVGEAMPMIDFLETLATATGGKAPRWHISPQLLIALTLLPAAIGKLLGSELPITPTLLRTVSHHWAYSSAKAERLLGVHFRDVRTGIVDWVQTGSIK